MVEIFLDEEGGWRWRVKGQNGEITGTSEGYTNPHDAERGYNDHATIVRSSPPIRKVQS